VAAESISAAWFTADSRLVAIISDHGAGRSLARVWDAATGHPVSPVLDAGFGSSFEGFSLDGHRLLSLGPNGPRLWDLSPDQRPAADLVAYAEVIAGYRLDLYGTRVEMSAVEQRDGLRMLQARYPAELVVTPDVARAWQLRGAEK
jgi:hypothetical protein